MGTTYLYKGNHDPRNGAERITGLPGDDLWIGGPAAELTDEQYAMLSTHYQLVPAGTTEEEDAPKDVSEDEPAGETTTDTPDETSTTESAPTPPASGGRRGARQP